MAETVKRDVSEESATSGEANPMDEAPAEPTEAQAEQGATSSGGDVTGPAKPSKEQLEQAKADAEFIANNPNQPHIREANPIMGGESFVYGELVNKEESE